MHLNRLTIAAATAMVIGGVLGLGHYASTEASASVVQSFSMDTKAKFTQSEGWSYRPAQIATAIEPDITKGSFRAKPLPYSREATICQTYAGPWCVFPGPPSWGYSCHCGPMDGYTNG